MRTTTRQRAEIAVPPLSRQQRDVMLLALTWAAGNVDAISYLGLGRVFTAMMTGNMVLLGLALGQGHVLAAFRSMLALAGFALGVGLGAAIIRDDPGDGDWPASVTATLALEATVLAAFAGTWHASGPTRGEAVIHVLIALCALAMGLQSAAVRRLGVPGIATTFITGTLTSLMVDLVAWLRHSRTRAAAGEDSNGATPEIRWEQRVGLLAGVFTIYGLGAFTGTMLIEHARLAAVSPLAAVATVTVIAASARRRRARAR
jgi:uncharacterized membrane protein YoaK (UPF0700 family)